MSDTDGVLHALDAISHAVDDLARNVSPQLTVEVMLLRVKEALYAHRRPGKFRFASRDLWFDPMGIDVIEGDHVICKTERGVEIGLATGDVFEVTQAEFTEVCGDAVLRPIVRLATADDLACAEVRADQSDRAMRSFVSW